MTGLHSTSAGLPTYDELLARTDADLDALAQACAADGRYAFLLTSAPLHLRHGVGSPPNALAIR